MKLLNNIQYICSSLILILFPDCITSMTDPDWSENDYEEYLMKLAASRRPSIFWKERLLIIPEENEDDINDIKFKTNKQKRDSVNKGESKKLDTIVEISNSTNDSTSIVHKVQTHTVPVNLQDSNQQSQEESINMTNGNDYNGFEMKSFTSYLSNSSQTTADKKISISVL